MKKSIKTTVFAKANQLYAENGTLVMVSSFIVWASILLLMFFPVFGFALSFFAMCFLCLGFKKVVLDITMDKNPKIENIFSYFKYCLSAFCLKVATCVIVLLWSLLFVIPGIIMGLNYVFAPYILAENPNFGAIKSMKESKKMVYGNRGNILVLYLVMVLSIVLVVLISSFIMIMINYITPIPLWLTIVVPTFVTLFVFFVFILPYFEIVFTTMYNGVKEVTTKTTKTRKTSKTQPKVQPEQ